MDNYEKFSKDVVDLVCSFTLSNDEIVRKILDLIDRDKYPELYLRYRQDTGTFA